MRTVKDKRKNGKAEDWTPGNRNNTLNKEFYYGSKEDNLKRILKAVFKSGKYSLSFHETEKTILSGINAGGGMPKLVILDPKLVVTKPPGSFCFPVQRDLNRLQTGLFRPDMGLLKAQNRCFD